MSNKLTTAAAILEWVGEAYSAYSDSCGLDGETYRAEFADTDTETAAYLAECVRIAEIVRRTLKKELAHSSMGGDETCEAFCLRSILAEASPPAASEHCLACLAVDRTGVDDGHPHTCAQSPNDD